MAVQTRAMKKRMMSKRKTARKSPCKGKRPYACAASKLCKNAKGKKRTFCRKKHNAKTHKKK